jgi:hypothetical protein
MALPCREQRLCALCWARYTEEEERVHRGKQRLQRQLATGLYRREPLVLRCPTSRGEVEQWFVPYIN